VQLDDVPTRRSDHGRRPVSDTGNTVLAITGGTGKYRNTRGWIELDYHNPQGTEFDFVFHLHGGPGH
jgi:hypothetical protein